MEIDPKKQPSLFSAIAIGVGCMVGSGWLFAAYFAAKAAGPASFISWIVGALLALILALLLAELSSMYKQRSLFSRLWTISHRNRDLGFVISMSAWLGTIVVIPSEAAATVQYLSSAFPVLEPHFYEVPTGTSVEGELTYLGMGCVVLLLCLYAVINYWGLRSLTKVNNAITLFKFIIPAATAVIFIVVSFNSDNFTSQGFAPYGYGAAIEAVVVAGVFYSFYGFAMIAVFGAELKNPERDAPIALVTSVLLVLGIYVLLQAAFIGALPTEMVAKGFANLDFTSPLAQLLILFHMNLLTAWATVLYVDSALSPSGTGSVYMGTTANMLATMAHDRQAPAFFGHIHPIHHLSRRSLLFSLVVCSAAVLMFKSWRNIMIVVTVFQLISCVAIPVAFAKLRKTDPDRRRPFRVPLGRPLSYVIYMVVCYMLTQATFPALVTAFIVHVVFFFVYGATYYQGELKAIGKALGSSWTVFVYLALGTGFAYLQDHELLHNVYAMSAFVVLFSLNYWALLEQPCYNELIDDSDTRGPGPAVS